MEDTFFRNPWNPVHHAQYQPQRPSSFRAKTTTPWSSPRVVSVPVQFVGSEKEVAAGMPAAKPSGPTEAEMAEAAAVRVQRVVRGFLVRKNVSLVRKVSAEVDEIEMRMMTAEEVLRRDEKERLRVSEMLMASLLKLDSARGVRDFRKKVIRRVIMLQEKLDSIVSSIAADSSQDQALEAPELPEIPGDESILAPNAKDDIEEEPVEETLISRSDEEQPNVSATREVSGEATGEETHRGVVAEGSKTGAGEQGKELLENLVAENRRLQVIVGKLCERSEQQCCLMGALAARVERLEQVVQRKEQRKKAKKCSGRKQL